MNAAQPDWVQQSLARLEALEAQREQLEAAGQYDRLAELDEEIVSLYEVLESVADDGDSGAANMGEGAPPVQAPAQAWPPEAAPPAEAWPPQGASVAAPAAALAAPMPGPFDAPSPYDGGPFGAPPVGAPVQAPPAAFGGGGFEGYDDVDDTPRSSKAPLVILGILVLVGAGVGVAMTMGGQEPPPAPAEPAGPAKVISSSEIPEDTQEPKAAQGLDVDQSEGTRFKESKGGDSDRRASSSSHSSSRPRSKADKPSTDRTIKFDGKSKDPLGGV